jgi:ribosomal protein L5
MKAHKESQKKQSTRVSPTLGLLGRCGADTKEDESQTFILSEESQSSVSKIHGTHPITNAYLEKIAQIALGLMEQECIPVIDVSYSRLVNGIKVTLSLSAHKEG